MMLVQVSVTTGDLGMDTIATLAIQNEGSTENDPEYCTYRWVVRDRRMDGSSLKRSGYVDHHSDDGAIELVRKVIEAYQI